MDSKIHHVLSWIAVLLAIPLLKQGSSVFLPLAIAVIAFHPFLPWFLKLLPEGARSKKSVRATLAVTLALTGILGIVVGALVSSGLYGASQQPELLSSMKSSFETAVGSDRVGEFISKGQSLLEQLIPILPGLALFIFLAWEYPPLRALYLERFGKEERSEALAEFEREGVVLRRFWGARTLAGFLTGLTVAIVLWFLNFPLAWLWGAINFLLNYIPTVGSFVGVLFPIGFAMVADTGVSPTVVALAVGGIQLVFGTFVDPLIQDRFLPLSSLTVFAAIMFWGWMWGPWGALIGVPLTFTLGKLSLFHPVYSVFGKLVIQKEHS
jgi:predicted PurR-regulated permease PerM